MKFRQIALTDRKEQKIFKTYEKGKENKVIVYTDKVYCDENGLVLTENMCIINIDSTRLVFADRISKIIYDKENNYFNFLDQYGYSITMISSVRKRLLVEGEDHQHHHGRVEQDHEQSERHGRILSQMVRGTLQGRRHHRGIPQHGGPCRHLGDHLDPVRAGLRGRHQLHAFPLL